MVYGTSWTCSRCAVRYRVGGAHGTSGSHSCEVARCGVQFMTGFLNKSRADQRITMTIAAHPLPEPGQRRETL
jgi:hypothetical protein